MREKLFLSYSTGDAEWRDQFLKHLRTMLSERQLFVDKQALRDGTDWKTQLTEALEMRAPVADAAVSRGRYLCPGRRVADAAPGTPET
jgi:hypothetical protein